MCVRSSTCPVNMRANQQVMFSARHYAWFQHSPVDRLSGVQFPVTADELDNN